MGCGASSQEDVRESNNQPYTQPQLVQATAIAAEPQQRHRATNWSHAAPNGPGAGASAVWLTVDGQGVQLASASGLVAVARLDLYTIASWRATPGQLLLKLTDGQVVSFDMDGGGYGVVSELERVCHAMATQRPAVAAPVGAAGGVAAAAPASLAPTASVDTRDMERAIAGCVTRLQEQMALRWLAVAAEVARLRAAAEATAASAEMLDRMSVVASAEGGDSVTLGASSAGEAAQREGRVCSACTFENEEIGESCTMCGGSLAPVVVSIPAGSTAGSSALAAAALAAAAEVVAEAVEAEDVSWLSE